jgi:BirA family biotin operon repressor/biotin-[acetyl-CoA-carboxylase] ligase
MNSSSLDRSVLNRIAGFDVHYVAECGSTNTEAAKLVKEKEPDKPFLVATDHQTGGVGRHDRSWFSRREMDIACTFVIPLAQCGHRRSLLPLATGLSAALALESLNVRPVALKWPNDIMLQGRKAGGILCRIIGESAFLAGIGLNYSRFGNELPSDLSGHVACIEETSVLPGRAEIIEVVSGKLLGTLTGREARAEGILQAWKERSVSLGRRVSVLLDGETISGIDCGLTDAGEMRIQLPEGGERHILDCLELRLS